MDFRRPGASALKLLSLLAAMAIVSGVPCIAQEATGPQLAPENPAFMDYVYGPQILTQGVNDFASGLVPEPFVLPQPSNNFVRVMGTLPATYDLRTQNKLTPVRDQGSAGACWAFATYGSLESSMMAAESWNLSENNLKNLSGFDLAHDAGGNRAMSAAYLARWAGPISEADDPYNPTSGISPTGLIPVKHVQDIIFLPNRTGPTDNDALKQAVMTYGAVYTTYYHSNSYYNGSTAAYYYNGGSSANHAVCIVGWDDSYSSSKFLTPPPGNGAFLIRNSWGSYWGMSGYFWMSYYDSRMGMTENGVYTAEPVTNYKAIYQYDDLGWVSNTGYGTNTAWFANVFTAKSSDPIAAASWYCPAPNSSYQLNVYTDPTSGPLNSAGPVASKTGTISTAGYHTVALDAAVPVTSGQRFSVVVKLTTPGYNYPICIERPYSGYSSRATASPGQSYMSSAGTSWSDVASSYANSKVWLKAFAGSGGVTPPPTPGALSVTPTTALSATGSEGGPFTPASAAYKLTNTGQTAINWTASATQAWLGLSSTSGNLAAGASVTVTASINTSANTLSAGSYADTVTFTNTTNASGNTTRAVALTVNAPAPPGPGVLSVTPSTGLAASGAVGGPFSPSTQTYTLTNTGGSAITWTAADTQSWVGLSSTGGTLDKGATAQVTVSVNSGANTLVAGSYSDTVTFTNVTNGTGNTTRPVSLSVTSGGGGQTGAYRVIPEPYAWITPAYNTKLTMGDNSMSPLIHLPFTFTFYGKPYTTLYVGSNGLLSFGSAGVSYYTNTDIPRTTVPNAAIYPYWDDLNPYRGGGVYVGTSGVAPNRKTVVSWVNVPWGSAPSTITFSFQAVLMEGSNDVVFQYMNVSPSSYTYGAGRSATIGIENETGTMACRYSYNTYGAVSNNSALRITNQ